MAVDFKLFFNSLRPHVNLTTENVAGTEFLIKKMEEYRVPINDAAYMLATAWWETAQRMQPIDEYGGSAYFNKRYGPQTAVGKVLGNKYAGDGAKFHGRGYVQLTGRSNYVRAGNKLNLDLVNNPEQVKDRGIAWFIMYTGMKEGWFTGKSLDHYIDDIDESDAEDYREYVNARRIINGTDKAATIAKLALNFERALKAGSYTARITDTILKEPVVKTAPKPEGKPVMARWIWNVIGFVVFVAIVAGVLKVMGVF